MSRVLLAEDDELMAMALEDLLIDLGYEVVGPASSIRKALALIDQTPFDVAILDLALTDGESYPIAERLREGAIPFVFATGRDADAIDPRFKDVPVLLKPFETEAMHRMLQELTAAVNRE
jgi:CheY-like chemotaxis protein